MDGTVVGLLVGFGLVAAVDWVAVARRIAWLEHLAKPGCMAFLVAAAVVLGEPVLVVALLLSTLGDVFLMLRGDRPQLFLAGLGSFLLAHVAYVVAFLLDGVDGRWFPVGGVLFALLVMFPGGTIKEAVIAGDEPEMRWPVTAYIAVIGAMVVAATSTGDGRAIAGALLFAGSDTLIARQRFIATRPWHPLAIIVSYHVAQALLVASFA